MTSAPWIKRKGSGTEPGAATTISLQFANLSGKELPRHQPLFWCVITAKSCAAATSRLPHQPKMNLGRSRSADSDARIMKTSPMKYLPLALLASLLMVSSARAGQYSQDFSAFSVGATSFGDGSVLTSDHLGTVAAVQDATYKELALTANGTGSTHSAFLLPDLDFCDPVYAFSAKWNADVYGDFPNNAADGFSFTFGQVGSLNMISSAGTQEDGFGTGICFSVHTYTNNSPGFYLKINGTTVASQPYNPASVWGNNSNTRHFFEVDWNYTNGVSVSMDGVPIFTNVATPGYTLQGGNRFAWASRCGALSEEVRLDNIA